MRNALYKKKWGKLGVTVEITYIDANYCVSVF